MKVKEFIVIILFFGTIAIAGAFSALILDPMLGR